MSNSPNCIYCQSDKTQAHKRGFSSMRAIVGFFLFATIFGLLLGPAGALVFGILGLFLGTSGSNKLRITCLNCGKKFRPGAGYSPK